MCTDSFMKKSCYFPRILHCNSNITLKFDISDSHVNGSIIIWIISFQIASLHSMLSELLQMEAYYYIKYLGFCSIILFFPIEQSLVNNSVPPVDYSWITVQENGKLFLREDLIAISIKSSPT